MSSKSIPNPLIGRGHRDQLRAITVIPLVDEDEPVVVGLDLPQPPYPPGQLQKIAVDIDRSFFLGLSLPDDELIRLDLIST